MAAKIGTTVGESQPYWPETPKRPKGAPNILAVLFDDQALDAKAAAASALARE
jgi:hypothetical protein